MKGNLTAPTIITHTKPTADSLTALWLARSFGGYAYAEIVVLPAAAVGSSPQARSADLVLGCGGEYSASRGRFDHHHDERLPSTAMLCYRWLEVGAPITMPEGHPEGFWEEIARTSGTLIPFAHFRLFVHVVDEAERGVDSPMVVWSRQHGPHAVLSALEAEDADDQTLIRIWSQICDRILDFIAFNTDVQAAMSHAVAPWADAVARMRGGAAGAGGTGRA
ncbi:MAG TPA: hypothetical protein VFS21_10865 [Roseiflexaceae bacterium]|nr:hypothetical protein [Roseiflexaceae bacterium]